MPYFIEGLTDVTKDIFDFLSFIQVFYYSMVYFQKFVDCRVFRSESTLKLCQNLEDLKVIVYGVAGVSRLLIADIR